MVMEEVVVPHRDLGVMVAEGVPPMTVMGKAVAHCSKAEAGVGVRCSRV